MKNGTRCTTGVEDDLPMKVRDHGCIVTQMGSVDADHLRAHPVRNAKFFRPVRSIDVLVENEQVSAGGLAASAGLDVNDDSCVWRLQRHERRRRPIVVVESDVELKFCGLAEVGSS